MAVREGPMFDHHVIDPYNGQYDLEKKILRHVDSDAFQEDPVRVLRLARFYARYDGFRIHPSTLTLCLSMCKSGELDHLTPERVWSEISRGLMEKNPSKMFHMLDSVGALEVIMPELAKLAGIPQPVKHHPEGDVLTHVLMALDMAAKHDQPLEVRWAVLNHDLGKALTAPEILPSHHNHEQAGVPLVEAVCARLKVPRECSELAVMVCREHTLVHTVQDLNAGTIVKLLERTDAFRRQYRFGKFLKACEMDARGRLGFEGRDYPQVDILLRAVEAVKGVDTASIVENCKDRAFLKEQILGARTKAVKAALRKD